MRSAAASLAVVLLFAGAPRAAALDDGLGIAGEWNYRTTSNCGALGLGHVRLTRRGDGDYDERGWVRWRDGGLVVRWWGVMHADRATRTLRGRVHNSLGDDVDGVWRLDAVPPHELRLDWDQTNGCHGIGVATRAM